ncbi:MAG: hypothetical protein OEY23_06250 [Acidimicrobiia bacterium]|nr:hypothetical protein [Acidimicrobiia bacterium]
MAFGQASGPPATHRQVQQLLDLLVAAGHGGFREARGPLGFTQRQAGGKFTRDEAQAFIDQLESAAEAGVELRVERPSKASATELTLRAISSEQLAAELQRRGWAVMEP